MFNKINTKRRGECTSVLLYSITIRNVKSIPDDILIFLDSLKVYKFSDNLKRLKSV